MKHISVDAFKEVIEVEKNNPTIEFINVCTPAEFAEKHISGVRNVPLDTLHAHIAELNKKQTIYVHCRSGNRSAKAIEQLIALGVHSELVNVEGGLLAWDEAGLPTKSHTSRLPIMRQTLLAAGVLVLIGIVLSVTVSPAFIWLSACIGAGLTFAGITGWCGMSNILARMPWNKV